MSTAPRLTINLSTLVENWRKLCAHSGSAETSAVIKADGYGLGIEPIAKALANAGCKTFFVAMMEEALKVQEIAPHSQVFVLNGVVPETVEIAKTNNIVPVLSSMDQITMWADQVSNNASAIHVDTGMNRLGLTPEEAVALSKNKDLMAKLNPQLIMSHLACADEPADSKNQKQLEIFQSSTNNFNGLKKSFSNSAGIMLGEQYHFDITRPGISIFGGEAINNVPNMMQQVVLAQARILQIRHAKKGESVGYGASHVLQRDTKIAVCSAGYADGFHRSNSGSGVPLREQDNNAGYGAIEDKHVPILGRVSMDLTGFDVTDIPDQILEDTVWIELFGNQIPVDDAARNCGTIGYELLTSLGHRYQREYIN